MLSFYFGLLILIPTACSKSLVKYPSVVLSHASSIILVLGLFSIWIKVTVITSKINTSPLLRLVVWISRKYIWDKFLQASSNRESYFHPLKSISLSVKVVQDTQRFGVTQ